MSRFTPMGQSKYWNYHNKWNETFNGIRHAWELAGPDGAHFHFWFPAGTSGEQRNAHAHNARNHWDIVSWSWDYIPE